MIGCDNINCEKEWVSPSTFSAHPSLRSERGLMKANSFFGRSVVSLRVCGYPQGSAEQCQVVLPRLCGYAAAEEEAKAVVDSMLDPLLTSRSSTHPLHLVHSIHCSPFACLLRFPNSDSSTYQCFATCPGSGLFQFLFCWLSTRVSPA